MKQRERLLLESIVFASFVIGAASAYGSAPGALDNTFGQGGIVKTSFTNISAGVFLFPPNGDIVAAAGNANYTPTSSGEISVLRFLANGAVDTTFGTQGITTFAFAQNVRDSSYLVSAALQTDGKILVLGTWVHFATFSSSVNEIGVARLNPNGALDTSFGQNGLVTLEVPDPTDTLSVTPIGFLLQSDGKILVTGAEVCSVGCDPLTAFVRFNPNGTLDTTFGQDGTELFHVYGGAPDFLAELTTGDLLTYSRNNIAQYSPSGALRPQVTGGPWVATSTMFTNSDVVQPDGKVLISTTVSGRSYQNFMEQLIRFLPTGGVDWAFENTPFFGIQSVAVQPDDGKIVVDTQVAPAFTAMKLLRFNSDGSVDTTFGSGGSVLTSIAGGALAPGAVTIQPDGKILVGAAFTPTGSSPTFVLVLARYLHLAH